MSKPRILMLLIGSVILLAGGAWFLRWQLSEPQITTSGENAGSGDVAGGSENSPPSDVERENWETYRNEEMGFEIQYPEDWAVEDPEFIYRGTNSLLDIEIHAIDYNHRLINANKIGVFVFPVSAGSDFTKSYPPQKDEYVLSVEPIQFTEREVYKTNNFGNDGEYTCLIFRDRYLYEICFIEKDIFGLPLSNFNPMLLQQILATFLFL